jgi:DNA-binding response OmpR family regulator
VRILVVEDNMRLAGVIKRGLVEEGYSTDCVYDGEEAPHMAENVPYDLIILDIMLPKKDGIAVCKELRAKQVSVPILMLTAKDSVEDRVKGLDSGADDYLTKPFAFSELLARVRALIQRNILFKTPKLQPGDMV